MNWKSWLLTILQKVFPSEKPDYEELQAWAREQIVHPIYAVELTCYRHGKPVALEQRSVGVWHCPICSTPKPSVWIDESEQRHVQIQMSTAPTRPFFESGMSTYEPPERTTDPFAEIHQHLQERRVLMRHNTRSLARKIQLIGGDPDATEYEVPAFLKDQAM